eukprot:CAMPEP_0196668836 /NCGR_PEP_ID=MMETSP1090-20130531/199_1 /TAXON_ID=37098 /ORGANISM="Isochrysis sp, Strain CCMP1244" /LENGTH=466 /DNA_ID=CAMNT_0042006295 /DNA_START=45 /DNA_END=1447 /DNA_ORIENTATION=-
MKRRQVIQVRNALSVARFSPTLDLGTMERFGAPGRARTQTQKMTETPLHPPISHMSDVRFGKRAALRIEATSTSVTTTPDGLRGLKSGESRVAEGGLRHDGREGEHRCAAVDELRLVVLWRLGRLEQPQRVKAKVAWLALRLVDGHVVDLRGADRLEGAHPEEQQEELLLSDDVVRVEGVELGVPRAREPQPEVDRHVARPRKHAHAAVLQLGLAHPLDVVGRGEAERVKVDIAHHALEVLRRLHHGHRLALHHLRCGDARRGDRRARREAAQRERGQGEGEHGRLAKKQPKAVPAVDATPTTAELVPQLPEAEAQRIREAWFACDSDGDSLLDSHDFNKLLLRINRDDLKADEVVEAIRRMQSKRKDQRTEPTDLLHLRETLRFFATNPLVEKPEAERLSEDLFRGLLAQQEGAADDKAPSTLSMAAISKLLADYELDPNVLFDGSTPALALPEIQQLLAASTRP